MIRATEPAITMVDTASKPKHDNHALIFLAGDCFTSS